MKSLSWRQVNAWRLSQQNLTHPLQPEGLVQAVGQSMGMHAQVMSAAEMAIGARVDGLTPYAVQTALWQDRTLIKTWMMRYTLHLVPADDFPLYITVRKQTDVNWPAVFERSGVDRATFDTYLAVAPEILNEGPVTRHHFVESILERIKSPELHDFMVNGNWSMAFKPLASRGELCFGPNDGTTTTFISPGAWISESKALEPEEAMRDLVRHYLKVYGPAKPRNFQVWWWMEGKDAKLAFKSIADETEEVEVEGWRAVALKPAITSMLELEPSGAVNLLPAFDIYTIGLARGKDLERLFKLEWQKKVYRQQGWVSAVVLVDGFIVGIWEHKVSRSTINIKVDLFSPVTNREQEGIAAEAERLGKFFKTPITLEVRSQ